MFDINLVGKGVVKQPADERDYKFDQIIVGAAPIDFSVTTVLPEPPNENQYSSSSCVAQASSYLHWQIHDNRNYSRRDLYSDIALPGGGAYLRDGVKRLCTFGQATRDEVLDPSPETEAGMLDKTGTSREKEASDLESTYFSIQDNIDHIAMAVRDYKGCIFGIYGNNAGFTDPTNPIPPTDNSQIQWGHALYAFGYGISNGKKYILAKSSWCDTTHHVHYITEDWFNKGMVFDAWSIIPNNQLPMANAMLVKNGGEYGLYFPASSADGLITLMLNVGLAIPYKTDPTTGKQVLDFTVLDGMVKSLLIPKI